MTHFTAALGLSERIEAAGTSTSTTRMLRPRDEVSALLLDGWQSAG